MADGREPLDALRNYVEAAWSAVGLSSWARTADVAPVDPEAAVVIALQLFKLDSRLGLELVDWCAIHGRILILGRLRRLGADAGERVAGEVEALISTVAIAAPQLKWKPRAPALPDFERSRRSSTTTDRSAAATARLRMRSVLGASARIEILYLLAAAGEGAEWTAAQLTYETALAKTRIYEALNELEETGVVTVFGSGRTRAFSLRTADPIGRGLARMAPSAPFPPWRAAIPIVADMQLAECDLSSGTLEATARARQTIENLRDAHSALSAASFEVLETGEPTKVRNSLRAVLAERASLLGYALAFGPPVGQVIVEAAADGTAELRFYSGADSARELEPTMTSRIERDGRVTSWQTQTQSNHAVSRRVERRLHEIAEEALDDAERRGVPVRIEATVS